MPLLSGLLLAAAVSSSGIQANLVGIPTVPFLTSSNDDGVEFDLTSVSCVVVSSIYADSSDLDGWTLIPPTLLDFATTFQQDWSDVVGRNVKVRRGDAAAANEIFLTLGDDDDFTDAAGRATSEAYAIDVNADTLTITGASPLGVWWGTRTLLQQAVLNNGKIAAGNGIDSPGWGTRGVFLDAGRHFYPVDFLVELCNWISFWKQNTLHLHLSDNLYNNVEIYSLERQLELYAAFRLWSDDAAVAGLNKRRNESYTREDYDKIQSSCAARGVTVIPEIEAPGHALVISQWKPNLGIEGQLDLLNISNPDTIPQMETIWKTFLPWFQSKVVHIGADEYVDSQLSADALVEVYNMFVNAMNEYIYSESGKSIRIWGTFPPMKNYTKNISTNVTVQHWEFFEDKTRIFHGNPLGGAFAPYVFDQHNASNNPPKDSPYVAGHIAAQWNDYGPNTSTYLEGYYSWRYNLPALADKQWGGSLTEGQYDEIYASLQLAAPAQNVDRVIKSKTSTILDYDFSNPGGYISIVKDASGNGYDGVTNCSVSNGAMQIRHDCTVMTPLKSKGNDYTLSMTLKQTSNQPGTILSGPDSELRAGNGSSSAVMLVSAGNAFALNYSLPSGTWVDASLIARGNRTFFSVDNGPEMEFLTEVGVNGERHEWARMAIVAPLQVIGGGAWEGALKGLKLVDSAPQ